MEAALAETTAAYGAYMQMQRGSTPTAITGGTAATIRRWRHSRWPPTVAQAGVPDPVPARPLVVDEVA